MVTFLTSFITSLQATSGAVGVVTYEENLLEDAYRGKLSVCREPSYTGVNNIYGKALVAHR